MFLKWGRIIMREFNQALVIFLFDFQKPGGNLNYNQIQHL